MVEPLNGARLRVGIVASRFNEEIVAKLVERANQELARLGVRDEDVTHLSVAGALEIPLALQWMAQSGRYDALVAIGAVIRGDTYHFEVVMDVALEFGVPVANGILTTNDEAQALARADKGAEAIRVAIEMARLRAGLQEQPR
jgi:6,7-dimethyl-8-ribityllumazine synthase